MTATKLDSTTNDSYSHAIALVLGLPGIMMIVSYYCSFSLSDRSESQLLCGTSIPFETLNSSVSFRYNFSLARSLSFKLSHTYISGRQSK